jgi:DNA polymerase-3 subunit epsilon
VPNSHPHPSEPDPPPSGAEPAADASRPGAEPAAGPPPSGAEPPAGAPWDDPLAAAVLAFVDLEMTGLDPERDHVVQICVERVVGERTLGRRCSFVLPRELGGTAIHGIEAAELEGAPSFAELAPGLLALLEGAVLVAHAAAQDVAFLRCELGRIGVSWPCPFFLDTLALARRAFVQPRYGLGPLSAALGIEQGRAHRADHDVRALRGLWPLLLGALGAATPRQLWAMQSKSRAALEQVLGVARQALELGRPVVVRYRRSGRPVERLELCVTAVRTNLDPPMVLGYLLHTRGRRELRADRILAAELVELAAGR